MISKKMEALVKNNSVIRVMFEEGQLMAKEFGAENVYDFSLGNPNIPAPEKVKTSIKKLIEEENPVVLHGYMNNAGFPEVRKKIADSLNRRFDTSFNENNIMMCVGAAEGLNCALKAILNPGDEVVTFAPYFVEYKNYVANYDGILKAVQPDTSTFMPDIEAFRSTINPKTKAVIINNPNNPAGVIYDTETIKKIAGVMEEKEKEYGNEIYLIADEPYRELVYTDKEVPYVSRYYKNSIICYSFSKTLSLPGERIGYLVIPDECTDHEDLFSAVTIANRVIGCVNAPSLFQKVVAECIDEKADIAFYAKNRNALLNGLRECGFDCIEPEGAFYLFMKTPTEDEKEFVAEAKKEHILVVPGSSFCCRGYVRIAYCVDYNTIVNSMPGFKRLAERFGITK